REQSKARCPLERRQRRLTQRRTEARVVVEQEPACPLRVSETPDRLRKARRGEIQQRQSLERRKVAHRRVERGDETFGGIELGFRLTRVSLQRRLARAPAPPPRQRT